MARQQQLVCQQLENISSVVLEEYQDIIRRYIRGRNGAYALYAGFSAMPRLERSAPW